MNSLPKRRLGRGLAALIGEDTTEEATIQDTRNLRHLPIELLHPNPHNPRKRFSDAELEELTNSIREKGVLQPLVVRPRADEEYEIVAGERRWRAAQRAGIHEIPALIKPLSDGEALEIALIENIQRADLNAIEEARGYAQLMEQFGYTQQKLADEIGKSRSHIANTLRLLTLPDSVRDHIETGELTAGHARALVAADDPAALAARIIASGLTVRQAEDLTRDTPSGKSRRRAGAQEKSADIRALEKHLADHLGLVVAISDRGGAGHLTVQYKTLEQLDDLCRRLVRGNSIADNPPTD